MSFGIRLALTAFALSYKRGTVMQASEPSPQAPPGYKLFVQEGIEEAVVG